MKYPAHLQSLLLVVLAGCSGSGGGGGDGNMSAGPPPPPSPPPPPPPVLAFSVLHSFAGGVEGSHPWGLVRDGAGNLYGTTFTGGDLTCSHSGYASGCGTVFKRDAGGVLTTLHVFRGGPNDGVGPRQGLVLDAAGNLYGGTLGGGADGQGVVYRLDPNGNMTVLHHFTGASDGYSPDVSLRDVAGNLYGVTGINFAFSACTQDCGTVFRLDAAGNLTTLHTFDGADGDQPSGLLIMDSAGNLYGTNAYGGPVLCHHPLGCGTVFRLDPGGDLTILHAFLGAEMEGDVPTGTLARDDAGNLYGTTLGGGINLGGAVYRIGANGEFETLNEFVAAAGAEETDHPQGQNPEGGVLLGPSGMLYGTTRSGGTTRWGTVFEMDPATGDLTVLHTFSPAVGGGPIGPLIADDEGNLYGTAFVGGNTACTPDPGCGIVFRIDLSD